MEHHLFFIGCVLLMAYVFDFTNGVHDAANSIAVVVTTGVLTPKQAVLWAAFFNFIAFLFFNLMVAKTIGSGLINPNIVDVTLIFAALTGAIIWNLLTWFLGLPSSSSYALIGGLAGAALVKGGVTALIPSGFIKVIIGMCLSPMIGIAAGITLAYAFTRWFKQVSHQHTNRIFKSLQLLSSAMLSLTHGGNDAQKTMGVITVLLFSASWIDNPTSIPLWVVISCHTAIALGTLMGGWRIVRTLGNYITPLNALRGCAAETAAASIIFTATDLGIPVSTTQTITGTIAGTGLLQGMRGVNWGTLQLLFISWVLTIPATGFIAGLFMLAYNLGGH